MKLIPSSVTRQLGRQLLMAKKHSPHILFGAGVAGSITSTVLACRATLKLNDRLDAMREKQIEAERKAQASSTVVESPIRQTAMIYANHTIEVGKLYGPAIIVGAASIACLTGSHVQLTRRNSALMAAYSAMQQAYTNYRDRVREELGEERELEIYHAIETEEVEIDGKAELVQNADPNKWSPYSRFFDEGSPYWEKNAELNRAFLQSQQSYFNQRLQARGYVFLSEVYDALGIERDKKSIVVGWVLGEDGDNYVDFGLFKESSNRFINGYERNIILDFNVDGVILDKF